MLVLFLVTNILSWNFINSALTDECREIKTRSECNGS